MEKAEFLRILAEGGSSGGGDRTSWVNILESLPGRENPFTKDEIAKEFDAKPKYVYSHLRDWVNEGHLVKINFGGANVYLHVSQVPTE